jgi:hypothetical protein
MRKSDRVQLLSGPYTPPALKRGDRSTCLFRDADVVITSWTAAQIPWPRCRRLEGGGGGSGLLVTEELVRAIRTESGKALQHWFGVSDHTVLSWRKAFGVPGWGTEGSGIGDSWPGVDRITSPWLAGRAGIDYTGQRWASGSRDTWLSGSPCP